MWGPICLELWGPLLEMIGSKKNVATSNKWRDDPLCENLHEQQRRRHIQCFRRLLLHKSRRPGKYFFPLSAHFPLQHTPISMFSSETKNWNVSRLTGRSENSYLCRTKYEIRCMPKVFTVCVVWEGGGRGGWWQHLPEHSSYLGAGLPKYIDNSMGHEIVPISSKTPANFLTALHAWMLSFKKRRNWSIHVFYVDLRGFCFCILTNINKAGCVGFVG